MDSVTTTSIEIPSCMVTKFEAKLNKVYFINQYTLVLILEGSGKIEVDFKSYPNWQEKAIYLEKGQYIKFLGTDFVVRFIEFPDSILFHSEDVRVLFKHLLSVGYINYTECEDCQVFLDQSVFNQDVSNLIDISTEQWYWQNPFQANKEEYRLIFDVKEVIDAEFANSLHTKRLVSHLQQAQQSNVHHLVKDKLGITINKLIKNKLLMESKKDVAFTDKSMKEIAYEKGYQDPSYFNRVFKNQVGQTPKEFRDNFDFENRDTFSQNLLELLDQFHKTEHRIGFYADKMNMSVKSLSKKVRAQLNDSMGQLIRHHLIRSAKELLTQGVSVKEVAYELGFEEAHHFSTYFNHYEGVTPSSFRK